MADTPPICTDRTHYWDPPAEHDEIPCLCGKVTSGSTVDCAALRQRPGDQPLPIPNGTGDVQSLVIADLRAREARLKTGIYGRLADDVAARREIGVQRYGTPLQINNGRDVLRDLLDELVDGMVHARQAAMEGFGTEDVELMLRHVAGITLRTMDDRGRRS